MSFRTPSVSAVHERSEESLACLITEPNIYITLTRCHCEERPARRSNLRLRLK
jgi:hypothetical protein